MSGPSSSPDTAAAAACAALVGLTSSTVFLTMNTTINYLTMPALFLGPRARPADDAGFYARPDQRAGHLNRQWQQVYWRGHAVGPGSALLSGAAYAAAAYLASSSPPTAAARHSARGLLLFLPRGFKVWIPAAWVLGAAAAAAVAVVPYTLIWMVPTNDELHRRGNSYTAGGAGDEEGVKGGGGGSAVQAKGTVTLVEDWIVCSKVRAGISLVGLVLGGAGVVALL